MIGARVLVIEDEPAIRDAVVYALERERVDVVAAETASAGLEAARRTPPDVIVLDVILPDGSGLDVCRDLRMESDVPIIMLTVRSSEIDRVIGLEVGADDYVVKPFSILELVSRVRAQVRRRRLNRSQGAPTILVGDLEVDLVRQEARVNGRDIALTPAEMRLVMTLAQQPDRAVSRDELMASLWGASLAGASRACDTHILNLRRKLEGSTARIETVRGLGYRLRV